MNPISPRSLSPESNVLTITPLGHTIIVTVQIDVQDALPLETTPLTVISTESQLLKLCDLLKTQSEIAVDTEVSSDADQGLDIQNILQLSYDNTDYRGYDRLTMVI